MEHPFKRLPSEVLTCIYAFDSTYRDIWNQVLHSNAIIEARQAYFDRAYSVRNWHDVAWSITPRYVLRENNRVYGSFIRHGRICNEPL